MWQRFTERARRVVFFAQEEAGRLGENYVSTEHLLLGLVRENDSVAARILDRMGISLGRIRSEIERQVTMGEGRLGQDMHLTPRAKRVIDLSYDEARQLSNNYIGTEHLLLGLIREGDGLAGRVLSKLGVDLDVTRKEVLTLQDNDSGKQWQGPTTDIESLKQEVQNEIREERSRKQAVYAAFGIEKATPVLDSLQAKGSLWRGHSLVGMDGVSASQIKAILDTATMLKALHKLRSAALKFSYPTTLALLFEKPSLRTRTSFEAGMAHLGGHAVYLAPADVGLGTRESVPDVAGALSRWVDVIAARVFDHATVEELSKHSAVPVLNALSDREHPLQMFADLLTLQEQKGKLGVNLKMAYVGDGNNVLHSLMLTCATVGVNLTAACPEGYTPDPYFLAKAQEIATRTESTIELIEDPVAAVRDSDAVYTDVWASMGQEAESEIRRHALEPYSITTQLMGAARPDAIVLHCMPAHCGEEISEEVMEKHRTVILDQAENRMHTQKALLLQILGL